MKKYSLITLSILFFINCYAIAETQRLAILPQTISIQNNGSAEAKSICIDYYRDAPGIFSYDDNPYNLVYSEKDIKVEINGKTVNRSFKSLVEGKNALLTITPLSMSNMDISLNDKNPESKTIKTLKITITKNATIGNLANDRNTSQSNIIFENYGYNQNQQDYWKKAFALDILQGKKMLQLDEKDKISSKSDAAIKNIVNELDLFGIFELTDLKYLADNALIDIDENGHLTKIGFKQLLGYHDYKKFVIASYVDYPSKEKFIKTIEKLYKLDVTNKEVIDTFINGERWVAMLSLKNKAVVEKYFNNIGEVLSYYKASDTIFKYALFMTCLSETQKWIKNNGHTLGEESNYLNRFNQLLGLTPTTNNDLFVELWVKESDLYRPAIDSSLASRLIFGKIDSLYLSLFNHFYDGSYKDVNFLKRYPFKGNGITLDWNPNNESHLGLSEFVLKENSIALVRRVTPITTFINKLKNE